jgi:hypothetical protein
MQAASRSENNFLSEIIIKTQNDMRIKRQTPKVSRERAIVIASNHNCVSKDVAEKYTDSELKEVLRQLKLKPAF